MKGRKQAMKDFNKKDIIYHTLTIGHRFTNTDYAYLFDYDDGYYYYYDVDSDSFINVFVDDDGNITDIEYNG